MLPARAINIRWNLKRDVQHHTPAHPTYSLNADNVDDVLHYEATYKVLLCTEHHGAIQNLHDHLRDHHIATPTDRKAIIQKYTGCERLLPAQVPLPPQGGPAFPALGPPMSAFRCDDENCHFISTHHVAIRRHCNKVHGWRVSRDDSAYWHPVYVQTFFTNRKLRRYFTVRRTEETPVTLTECVQGDDDIQAIKLEWTQARQQHNQEMEQVDGEIAKHDRTGWYNRTGWPEHLAKRNMRQLAHASRLPYRDERTLQQAVHVVDLMMHRAVGGLSTLGLETRRWSRSAKREEADVRPMSRLQNPESQNTYTRYWARFMCYCLRVAVASEEEDHHHGHGQGDETENERDGESGDEEGDEQEEDDGESKDEENEEQGEDDSESDSEESEEQEEDDSESDSESDDEHDDEEETSHHGERVSILRDACELFPWQSHQKELAQDLWQSLEVDDEETQITKMLEFSRTFIFHTIGDGPFSSGLIHFLAVLGINEDLNRLRTAIDYSYMLAGVVYCTRALAMELLLPSSQRDEQGDEERQHFLQMRREYLADGTYSPMSRMISLLAYGKSVAMNSGNAGSVSWSKDKQTMYYHGRPISMARFRRMITDVITRAEHMLWEELMWMSGRHERFHIALDRIEDDVTFTKRGISFLSKTSNGLTDGLDWMLGRMWQSPVGRQMRVKKGWNARRIRRYLRLVDDFLELLLFCVHSTAGQPARGTEITTVRFQNGCFQDRNIFVIDGRVVMITRYHKSQSLFDRPKIIPRFLPWRVGQLVALYLVYVQQFREHLMVQALGKGWSDYVWSDANGPWETDRLTRVITRETATGLENRLTTLDYRHTAISIGREFVGENFAQGYKEEIGEVEEPEVEVENGLELQAGRGEAMGAMRYGVRSDVIQHLSIRSLETFRPLSEAWHRFLGLDSDAPKTRPVVHEHQLQRKRGIEDVMLPVEESPVPPPKRIRTQDRDRSNCKERHQVCDSEVQQAIQRVLGQQEVQFRSPQQKEALEAVLASETPLVVVLPTGGGKTLLAMAPAALDPTGVTIFVAPFRALVDNMVSRFRAAGIECLEWRPGVVNPAPIVVVSADFVSSWGFLGYASLLDRKGLLRRTFVDECHLAFRSSDWRPKLAQLKHLRTLSCPIILLTATLPPVMEYELAESMLIRCARYVRTSTVRPQVRYLVQSCEAGKLQETALQIGGRMKKHLGRQKGVVYCRSRQTCEDLAEGLGSAFYHAGSVEKAEKLEAWVQDGGLIVATSALGTGVDYAGIVFVLHVGMPYGMIDFAQESGRAGRGGERVDSIVLVEDGWVEGRLGQIRKVDESAMATFIVTRDCRRGVMSEYLDGCRIECGNVDGARCDRCGEGLVEWQQSQARGEGEWRLVRRGLDEMTEGCAACWIMEGDEAGQEHSLGSCQKCEEMTQQACDSFRRFIVYAGNSHSCTKCGLSQKLCATGKGERMACQWPNVLVAVVRAAMGSGGGLELVRKVGYAGGYQDWREYGRWLGYRHERRVWGEWMSNAMVVLIEVVLHLLGQDR